MVTETIIDQVELYEFKSVCRQYGVNTQVCCLKDHWHRCLLEAYNCGKAKWQDVSKPDYIAIRSKHDKKIMVVPI